MPQMMNAAILQQMLAGGNMTPQNPNAGGGSPQIGNPYGGGDPVNPNVSGGGPPPIDPNAGSGERTPVNPNMFGNGGGPPPITDPLGGNRTPQSPGQGGGPPPITDPYGGNRTPQNPGQGGQGGGQGGGMGGLQGLFQMLQQFQQGNNQTPQNPNMFGNGGGQGTTEQQAGRFGGGMRGGQGGGQQAPFNFGNLIQHLMQQRQGGYGQQQRFQQTPQMGGQGYNPTRGQQPSGGQYWNYHPQPVQPTSAGGAAPGQTPPAGGMGGGMGGGGSQVNGQFQPLPQHHGGSLYGMPEYGNSNVYSRSEGPQNTYYFNGNNQQWGDESNGAFAKQFGGGGG